MLDNGAWPDLRIKGQSDSRVLLASTFHSTFLTDGRLCSITPGKCAENASERIEDETEVGRIHACPMEVISEVKMVSVLNVLV